MARTFRRTQERHEYRWVLRHWKADLPRGAWIDLDSTPIQRQGARQLPVFIPTTWPPWSAPRRAGRRQVFTLLKRSMSVIGCVGEG